jgi:hypothetical protein
MGQFFQNKFIKDWQLIVVPLLIEFMKSYSLGHIHQKGLILMIHLIILQQFYLINDLQSFLLVF